MALMEELKVINSKFETKSLITGSETVEILNLGIHGYADSFFLPNEFEKASQGLPLICRLDLDTGLVQTQTITDPIERYSGVDYSYTSSNSATARRHWTDFASNLRKRRLTAGSKILEIGSNDGFLLSQFLGEASQLVGVDASPYMVSLANSNGVKTFQGVFGESDVLNQEITEDAKEFDIIIANNVLNHSNNPVNFLRSIANLLSPKGDFVFEVPYWLETIRSLHFDQIYHEHVTYLTAHSVERLLEMADLFINEIEVVDYHGGSLRVIACHKKPSEPAAGLLKLKEAERLEELRNPLRYVKYFNDILQQKENFLQKLNGYKIKKGEAIFGIGAAAKANTLLTFYGLDNTQIDFLLDASEYKQGKITPITRIPIYPDSHLAAQKGGIGITLAWNIGESIKKKLYTINKNIEVISI
jgi:SAM-dependent methyltransferase